MKAQKLKKGELVRIKLGYPVFDKKVLFYATVLECRYKSNIYRIYPANSPFTTEPYWLGGDNLEPLR